MSIVVFFLTENMTLPLQIVDAWTLLMAVFLVFQIISAIVLRQVRKERDGDDSGNLKAASAA